MAEGYREKKDPEVKKEEKLRAFEVAYEACSMGENNVTANDLAEYLGVSKNTVWNRIKEHGGYKSVPRPGEESIIVPAQTT